MDPDDIKGLGGFFIYTSEAMKKDVHVAIHITVEEKPT